jgi:hypothetical protein
MAQVYKINDVEYECEFKLTNADGQEVEFTKSAIRGMTIISNIFEPFESGTVSIANPYDFIENEYLMRGDGRDEFKIMFRVKDQPENKKYENTFIITDDANSGNLETRAENIKTYSLVDKKLLPFLEEIPYGKVFSGKIGDIIKDIFKDLLGDDAVDEDVWESGDFDITYSPNVSWRYIDFINEMLHYFYAKDGDINVKAFLNYNHIDKKFQFPLISNIFKENKDNVIDAFSIGDLTNKFETENENNPPPDAETGEYIGGSRNLTYSTPAHDVTNNFFISRLVHGYDNILGEMLIKKIDIKEARDKWAKKFVDVFKSIGGKPKPFVVLNNTASKKFKHFRLPYPFNDNIGIVESELNMSLIFYNLQSYFTNVGDSSRQAGKFIDIYKPKKQKLKSDEKLLGRWFLTEVRHVFFGDLYTNQFFCTKTYVGTTSNIKDDVD